MITNDQRNTLYETRLQLAREVVAGIGALTQKDWHQLGVACQYARSRADAQLFERAYRHATDRLRIVGAGT